MNEEPQPKETNMPDTPKRTEILPGRRYSAERSHSVTGSQKKGWLCSKCGIPWAGDPHGEDELPVTSLRHLEMGTRVCNG